MVRPGRELLKGAVEIDETYLAITDRESSADRNVKKCRTNKILVAIAR